MQASVLRLLGESGITDPATIDTIRDAVRAGEVDIAFDFLCTRIDDDQLPISAAFHAEAAQLAVALYQEKWVEDLRPLVR
jgi:hypothetical protein